MKRKTARKESLYGVIAWLVFTMALRIHWYFTLLGCPVIWAMNNIAFELIFDLED